MNANRIPAEEQLKSLKIRDRLNELESITKDFYYDETNNYRKFHIKSGKLNIEDAGEFLLGGVHVNKGRLIDISQLKNEIRLDKTAKELKFKHVGKESLSETLKSRKIKTILEFLLSENINIHFQRFNSLNWGIVDIFESILTNPEFKFTIYHLEIKDYLYHALTNNLLNTISTLYNYNYPDIDTSKIKNFYRDITRIVEVAPNTNTFLRGCLLEALHLGANQDEAVFIQDQEELRLILVDDYSHLYRNRTLTFPTSNHYFDMEKIPKHSLEKVGNSFHGIPLNNFEFLISHDSDGIQLSDVIIGLMSKIINYCTLKTELELISFRKNLGTIENSILDIIWKLISRSDNESPAYFHNVIPISHVGNYVNLLRRSR